MVEKCPLVMNGWVTCVDMNVLPLGSYDVLIRMDWLEYHSVKIDCYHKNFEPESGKRHSKGNFCEADFSNVVEEIL